MTTKTGILFDPYTNICIIIVFLDKQNIIEKVAWDISLLSLIQSSLTFKLRCTHRQVFSLWGSTSKNDPWRHSFLLFSYEKMRREGVSDVTMKHFRGIARQGKIVEAKRMPGIISMKENQAVKFPKMKDAKGVDVYPKLKIKSKSEQTGPEGCFGAIRIPCYLFTSRFSSNGNKCDLYVTGVPRTKKESKRSK